MAEWATLNQQATSLPEIDTNRMDICINVFNSNNLPASVLETSPARLYSFVFENIDQSRRLNNQVVDVYKKGMFPICAEICPIAIPAFLHQIQIKEFSQFGLNCTDGKTDAPLNFTHVQFFSAEAK